MITLKSYNIKNDQMEFYKNKLIDNCILEPNTGCWLWQKSTQRYGYGAFCVKNKVHTASRISYLLFNGNIPDNLFVLHKCDIPACCNPNHLFLGNQSINMKDCVKKKRHATSNNFCKYGHEFTLENTRFYQRKNGVQKVCKECKRINSKKEYKQRKLNGYFERK